MTPQNTPAFFLGIDVGKDRLDLALLAPEERTHTKSFRNDPSGQQALIRWLERFTDAPGRVHA